MSVAQQDEHPTSPFASSKPDAPQDSKAGDRKRRASVIPSKRSARNLNPDQLARKRANDREAQRAIRERTKSQIETLETRIQELESGKAFQKLQDVIREKQELQQENEEMRSRLVAVLDLVAPIAGKAKLPSDTSGKRQRHPASKSLQDAGSLAKNSSFSLVPSNQGSKPGVTRSNTSTPGDIMMASDGDANTQPSSPDSQISRWLEDANHVHGLHCVGSDLLDADIEAWNPYVDQLQHYAPPNAKVPPQPYQAGLHGSEQDLTRSHQIQQPYAPRGPIDPAILPTPPVVTPTEPPPLATQLPYTCAPACRIDNILQDYVKSKRQQLADGASVLQIIGPPYADFTNLMYPDQPTNEHSISMLFIEIQRAFTTMEGWPERLGMISFSVLFMRWYICPTQETFDAMPQFMRPIDAQIKVEHPAWVDLLPWPRLRAKMIYHSTTISFDDFFLPYTSTLSVNWPDGKDAMSCLDKHPEDGVLRITPALAAHASILSNWTLGPEFAEMMSTMTEYGSIE